MRYDREALERLCREQHVRLLDLFGSRAKGTDGADSDVDLLVEFTGNAATAVKALTLRSTASR